MKRRQTPAKYPGKVNVGEAEERERILRATRYGVGKVIELPHQGIWRFGIHDENQGTVLSRRNIERSGIMIIWAVPHGSMFISVSQEEAG